jgi:hypothetical protein
VCGASTESDQCSRGTDPETASHVLLECPLEAGRGPDLKESLGGRLDFTGLLDTQKGGQDSQQMDDPIRKNPPIPAGRVIAVQGRGRGLREQAKKAEQEERRANKAARAFTPTRKRALVFLKMYGKLLACHTTYRFITKMPHHF